MKSNSYNLKNEGTVTILHHLQHAGSCKDAIKLIHFLLSLLVVISVIVITVVIMIILSIVLSRIILLGSGLGLRFVSLGFGAENGKI